LDDRQQRDRQLAGRLHPRKGELSPALDGPSDPLVDSQLNRRDERFDTATALVAVLVV